MNASLYLVGRSEENKNKTYVVKLFYDCGADVASKSWETCNLVPLRYQFILKDDVVLHISLYVCDNVMLLCTNVFMRMSDCFHTLQGSHRF